MFTGLISATQRNVFARGRVLDDEFLSVCSPVEQSAIKVQDVSTGALTGIGLPSQIDVS